MIRSFPSFRGSIKRAWYDTGGEVSDKNLEQKINI
jgi:hypothetical protein